MSCRKCYATLNPAQMFCSVCGEKVEHVLQSDSIDPRNKKFDQLLERANSGQAQAQAEVGKIYLGNSATVRIDFNKACTYFLQAAAQNNALGYWGIACLYFYGIAGYEKNYKKVMEFCIKSIDGDCSDGMALMGVLYRYGHGVEKNLQESYRWYKMAADRGDARGQAYLGSLYLDGDDTPTNTKYAFQYLKQASDQGDVYGQAELARMYSEGKGIDKDIEKSLALYGLAIQQNSNYLITRAELYRHLDRVEECLADFLAYYKENDPNPTFSLDKIDWTDFINCHLKSIIVPTIKSKNQHFIAAIPCYAIINYQKSETSIGGNSNSHTYGATGIGYIAITDRSVVLALSGNLSSKYREFKTSPYSLLSRNYWDITCINTDVFLQFDYSLIRELYEERFFGISFSTTTTIKILPYFYDTNKMIISAIQIGQRGAFSNSLSPTAISESDPFDKLKRIKELWDVGILSEQEYHEKKKKLMAEMGL